MLNFLKRKPIEVKKVAKPLKPIEVIDKNDEEIDPDELLDEVIELKAALDKLAKNVVKLVEGMSIVDDLRKEITELKCDLRNQNDFMQTIIMEMIKRPAAPPAPTAAEKYAAMKAAASNAAAPKGKLP